MTMRDQTTPALEHLAQALDGKATEFWSVIKTGRTHLQDATPIRLGQEFRGYAGQVERGLKRLRGAAQELSEVALGGTAVGTGVGAHPEFARRALEHIQEMTGIALVETENHFVAQSTIDTVLNASGILRTIAVGLMKVANDIRWMSSGPRTGLGELRLPAVQPGSSIMPGKVNPVIAESLIQAAAQVIGNDAAITTAAQGSDFELNTMMPVAAHNFLESLSLLAAASDNFTTQCIKGLEATDRGPQSVALGLGLATSLAPVIGYDAAAEIAHEASQSGRSILDVAIQRLPLSRAELEQILNPENML
jgi:fumarate hydratase class II